MANPQKENGFTPIANEILEALSYTQMSGYEWRVLMVIIRKTYGYQKKEDRIPNSQFVALTGIHKGHITRTLQSLKYKNIVTKNGNKIQINKDYEKWKVTKFGNKKLPKMVTKVTKFGTLKRKKKERKAKINFRTSSSKKNMYKKESEIIDQTVDMDTLPSDDSQGIPPENKNKKWWAFLKWWKEEVKKRRGAKYLGVGGDYTRFHQLYPDTYNGEQLRKIIKFYFEHKLGEDDVPTIRAALSNHTIMAFLKWRKR